MEGDGSANRMRRNRTFWTALGAAYPSVPRKYYQPALIYNADGAVPTDIQAAQHISN